MASNRNFVDFVLEQIKNAGEITAKKCLANVVFTLRKIIRTDL
jgi:hypothetical protein